MDPGAPRLTGQSVLITFSHRPPSGGRSFSEYEQETLLALFARWQTSEFASGQVHYLRENSHHGLRTALGNVTRSWPVEALRLGLTEKRVPRPYRMPVLDPSIDLLVKIDLAGPLTQAQIDALQAVRAELGSAGRLHIAKSTNYRCYENGTPRQSDTSMGFLTRWRPGTSLEEQDEYWKNGHGRYAVSQGFPPQLRSYDQLHHGTRPADDVFDGAVVGGPSGWSFEVVGGRLPILRLALNPRMLKANWRLIADERKFTLSPEWLVFERVSVADG